MIDAFDRSVGWIVEKPWVTALMLLAITTLAVVGYVNPEIITDRFPRAAAEDAAGETTSRKSTQEPPAVDPVNLARSDAILIIESDKLFSPQGAAALRAIVTGLESLRHVRSVLWLDNAPVLNIFGFPEPLLPRSTASEERFERARQQAIDNPLVGGQLLSRDGRTLLMLLRFDTLMAESDEDCTLRIRQTAEEIAVKNEVDFNFLVTGRIPLEIAAEDSRVGNQANYRLIAYTMIAIMSLILFRGVWAVIVVAIAPSLGVFWTLGMLNFFEYRDSLLNDVVLPILLSLIGLTDGVHLMVQIRNYRAKGLSRRDAARKGLREVGLACGLTSLTTAIGLGSLMLAHHESVREFGEACVIGVLLTFIAVISSIPLACITWLGKHVHVGHDKGFVDRHLSRVGSIVEFVLRRQKRMAILGIVVTLVLCAISLQLRPDERRTDSLPERSEAAVGMQFLDRALGGLEFAYVDLSWNDEVDTQSPEILDVLEQIDQVIRQEELIGNPLSILNLLKSLPGDGPVRDRMSLLELMPPPLKRAFYTPERRSAKVSFRVQDLGIAAYGPVFERVQQGLEEIRETNPGFTIDLSGSAVWRWENLYKIVMDLATSLGTAIVIIFVVLTLVYRSLRMGLISLLPNLFPLAVTGSFLVFLGQPLEMVTVCAFTVCLGIAVDDTIHFLTRFEEERARQPSRDEAIRRAFTGVGTALVMTTIVLVAGFSTVLWSDARIYRMFALMGMLTISAALFGDLVFLPALLARFAPKTKSTEAAPNSNQQ